MVPTRFFFASLTLATLVGCALPAVPDALDDDLAAVDVATWPVADGSSEAIGVLALLNDGATTVDLLDFDIALDSRAAGNLVGHRDGGDDLFGTSDDDLFGDMTEVDDVRWVGASAIGKLAAYATDNGYVPLEDEVLGTWDGVQFTVSEAEATVAFANAASHDLLDYDLGLDRRAVDSIVAAQPIASVAQLAGLYYVGHTALATLKDEALVSPEPEPCVLSVVGSTDADAADFTELMALSTTMDWAFSEVIALQANGCDAWLDDADAAAAMTVALWNAASFVDWDELPADYRDVGPFVAGGADFTELLDDSLTAVDERILDGDWNPADSAQGQALFDARFDLVDGMRGDLDAKPGAWIEQHIVMDMAECSEEAAALIDTRDGSILLVHENPHC
jgi:hypothetical protein